MFIRIIVATYYTYFAECKMTVTYISIVTIIIKGKHMLAVLEFY